MEVTLASDQFRPGRLDELSYIVGESMVALSRGLGGDLKGYGVEGLVVSRAEAAYEGLDVISRCSHDDLPRVPTVER